MVDIGFMVLMFVVWDIKKNIKYWTDRSLLKPIEDITSRI